MRGWLPFGISATAFESALIEGLEAAKRARELLRG